ISARSASSPRPRWLKVLPHATHIQVDVRSCLAGPMVGRLRLGKPNTGRSDPSEPPIARRAAPDPDLSMRSIHWTEDPDSSAPATANEQLACFHPGARLEHAPSTSGSADKCARRALADPGPRQSPPRVFRTGCRMSDIPGNPKVSRTLAAILAADIAGY